MLVNNKLINGRNNRQSHQVDWLTGGSGEEQRDESTKRELKSGKRPLDRERGKLSKEKPIINQGLHAQSYSMKCIPTDAQVLEYIIQRD